MRILLEAKNKQNQKQQQQQNPKKEEGTPDNHKRKRGATVILVRSLSDVKPFGSLFCPSVVRHGTIKTTTIFFYKDVNIFLKNKRSALL
jgi:hypothetical protein